MAGQVSRRPYRRRSRLRGAQATREAILAATRTLFAERRFEGTTISAIAERAQVAPQTVYAAFGSKRAIAAELRGFVEREAGIVEQHRAALAESDASRRLELVAALTRGVCERHGDLYRLFTASTEPELQAVGLELLDAQRFGMRQIADALDSKSELRVGLDPADAATIMWSLASVEMYEKLVVASGWPPDRFEAWLAEALKALVLRRP